MKLIRWQLSSVLAAVITFAVVAHSFASGKSALTPVNLRCDYRTAPLAIETAQPRLSWILQSSAPGAREQRQAAFHILIATTREGVMKDKADLWDSGKIFSDAMAQIVYGGKPLNSRQECWWKVRVWDEKDHASAWSEPVSWTMGLLQPADWKAKWISSSLEKPGSLEGASWIWFSGDVAERAPPGTRYFRKAFRISDQSSLVAATARFSADNEFILYVNGNRVGDSDRWEAFKEFNIKAHLIQGQNVLAIVAKNTGSVSNAAGLVGKITLQLQNQEPFEFVTDSTWKSSRKKQPQWETVNFDDATWKGARELGKMGMRPWGNLPPQEQPPLPVLRRAFPIGKNVKRAVISICGLGFYELHLNGKKVGEDALDPGWTDYRKRCLYSTFDVTPQVRRGENVIGVMLGNGMYNVRGGRYTKFTGSFGEPKLILQMQIDFADGTSTELVSDDAWKTAPSPITFSCIYGGEDYDARMEQTGWDEPGFKDSMWKPAVEVSRPGGRLVAQSAPPIRVMQQFETSKVSEPKPGVFIYDLRQNFSGWPELTVKGPPGSTVKLTCGELLDEKGLVTQRSSGGPNYFSYTLKGNGVETWHPRFSYYGFRYVQMEGGVPAGETSENKPIVRKIRGNFVHSSARRVGEFDCSSDLFNRIHRLILASIDSNMQSVLTDCPHREKLGWLEVSHLLGPAILSNYEAPLLYEKISDDMADAQLESGLVPDIAPEYIVFGGGFRDSPEWGSASVLNPWLIYERFGDTRLLAKHYESMKRYVAYLGSKAEGQILNYGLGDWYDIGPGRPGVSKLTSLGLTATAIYFQDVMILQKTATLLGKNDDAQKFAALAESIRIAFNQKFLNPETSQYDRSSQTANAMPLVFDLAPREKRSLVVENLINDVRSHQNHLTAGDVGFRYLVQALNEAGRSDVIFDIATRTDAPSYADQLNQGATTLTEAWDCDPHSSQNHCMLGHLEEWFYSGLAGINPDPVGVGFRKIVLSPKVVGDLTWAKASYESICGTIKSSWKRENQNLVFNFSIPPNTRATVYLPGTNPEYPVVKNGSTFLEIGSGEYEFRTSLDQRAAR